MKLTIALLLLALAHAATVPYVPREAHHRVLSTEVARGLTSQRGGSREALIRDALTECAVSVKEDAAAVFADIARFYAAEREFVAAEVAAVVPHVQSAEMLSALLEHLYCDELQPAVNSLALKALAETRTPDDAPGRMLQAIRAHETKQNTVILDYFRLAIESIRSHGIHGIKFARAGLKDRSQEAEFIAAGLTHTLLESRREKKMAYFADAARTFAHDLVAAAAAQCAKTLVCDENGALVAKYLAGFPLQTLASGLWAAHESVVSRGDSAVSVAASGDCAAAVESVSLPVAAVPKSDSDVPSASCDVPSASLPVAAVPKSDSDVPSASSDVPNASPECCAEEPVSKGPVEKAEPVSETAEEKAMGSQVVPVASASPATQPTREVVPSSVGQVVHESQLSSNGTAARAPDRRTAIIRRAVARAPELQDADATEQMVRDAIHAENRPLLALLAEYAPGNAAVARAIVDMAYKNTVAYATADVLVRYLRDALERTDCRGQKILQDKTYSRAQKIINEHADAQKQVNTAAQPALRPKETPRFAPTSADESRPKVLGAPLQC